MPVRSVETLSAPKAIGPYSQAVAAGPFLFLSGQIPIDPETGEITSQTIEGQTEQVIDNIEAILKAEGLTLSHVVKSEVFLKDMHDFAQMNTTYAKRFNGPIKPARHTVQVAKLPLDVRVEITCTAYRG